MSHMTDAIDFTRDGTPVTAKHYLAHTVEGRSLRELAREAGCHPSTIMRQVRKIEQMRDDPLVDAALNALGARSADTDDTQGAVELSRQELRILTRLTERGAMLAIGEGMDKAVVVRELETGHVTRTAVIDVSAAESMALSGLITAHVIGKISRYTITTAGRTYVQSASDHDEEARRLHAPDPPVIALSRRRDKNGETFLTTEHVKIAERIREDYEIAALTDPQLSHWSYVQKNIEQADQFDFTLSRDRLIAILSRLGPSMGEAIYRCCCRLEGLESLEQRKFWSARSGKIVLRIALECAQRCEADIYQQSHGFLG